ncbi:MAG: hypothetical protein WC686_03470 [Candidatus Shapirobacteria bacterium]
MLSVTKILLLLFLFTSLSACSLKAPSSTWSPAPPAITAPPSVSIAGLTPAPTLSLSPEAGSSGQQAQLTPPPSDDQLLRDLSGADDLSLDDLFSSLESSLDEP